MFNCWISISNIWGNHLPHTLHFVYLVSCHYNLPLHYFLIRHSYWSQLDSPLIWFIMYPPAASPPPDISFACTHEELFVSLERMMSGFPLPSNVITDINPYIYICPRIYLVSMLFCLSKWLHLPCWLQSFCISHLFDNIMQVTIYFIA